MRFIDIAKCAISSKSKRNGAMDNPLNLLWPIKFGENWFLLYKESQSTKKKKWIGLMATDIALITLPAAGWEKKKNHKK